MFHAVLKFPDLESYFIFLPGSVFYLYNHKINYVIFLFSKFKLFGRKFEKNEPDFCELLKYAAVAGEVLAPSLHAFIYDVFPWLHYLPLPYCKQINEICDGFVKDWIPKQIKHKKVCFHCNFCLW